MLKLDKAMINELFDAIVNCGIELVEPNNLGDNGGKIGYDADHQLNIFHEIGNDKYSFNFGPVGKTNYYLTRECAINEFIASIINISKNYKIQFVSLVVPKKAVDIAQQTLNNKIFIRYIVDYMPQSDCLAERWDVLIKKVN